MSRESNCRCLVCGMERHLAEQFAAPGGARTYRELAASSPVLSTFADTSGLIAYLHADTRVDNGHYAKDEILAELLRKVSDGGDATPVREILLLAFVPTLHSLSRHVATRCPMLAPDDIAQHVVAALLETFAAEEFSARDSHIAFAIARHLRRNAFLWAERECRGRTHAASPESFPEVSLGGGSQPIERIAVLRHFLERCRARGVLSDEDLGLLVQFKLDDRGGGDYSNASRQRMKRLLAKLRRAAEKRTPDSRQLRLF